MIDLTQPPPDDHEPTSHERLIRAGHTPCPKCIWFKGEVSLLCENHQHLAGTLTLDMLDRAIEATRDNLEDR